MMIEPHFQELMDRAAAWSDATFGTEYGSGKKLHHLKQEVDELIDAPKDLYEYADAALLLFDAARTEGYTLNDIYYAMSAKLAINRNRTWGPPDENGVRHHVKETSN